MASGPNVKTSFQKLFDDTLTRVTLLERRVAIGGAGGGGGVPYDANPGMIMPYAGATAPTGWLLCDGTAVSRTLYSALFGAIGTAYGAGDGSTTFNLPNLKGKVPYGKDAAQTEFDVMGETGGAKTHTLTTTEIPAHAHDTQWAYNGAGPDGGWIDITRSGGAGRITGGASAGTMIKNAGGGGAHNNMPPYVVTNYIISTGQGVGGGGTQSTGGGDGGAISAGIVSPYAGADSAVPTGWLLCDGRLIQRTQYPALFAAIGVTYGAGDGTTTFGLPNYKGRTLVGLDAAQAEFDALGETGGTKSVTLTANQSGLRSHRHQLRLANAGPGVNDGNDLAVRASSASTTDGQFRTGLANDVNGTLGSNGYGSAGLDNVAALEAHNNLQPYAVANYIISTGAGSSAPVPVVPVPLWQEFSLTGSGLIPVVSGSPAWTVVKGNLGATLDANKVTITLPQAGTYRILPHLGVSGSNQLAANANATINGVNYTPSFSYGALGPAGAWSYDTEVYITVAAGATVRHYVSSGTLYDWSWLRIEKVEPFYAKDALTVQQGSTALRDAIYGVPATDAEKASLANRMISWFNTDKGYFEIYYATTGTTGLTAKGLATGFPAGWYPAAGSNIWGAFPMLNAQTVAAGEVRINLNTGDLVGGMASGNNVMTVPVGGIYETNAHLYIWGTSGSYRGVQAFNVADGTVYCSGTTSANWDIAATPRRARIPALAQIGLRTSGDAGNTIQGQSWPALEVKYMGPPLVNG